jgi:[histone H3]-trimethyl-L-lysine4 demethylase
LKLCSINRHIHGASKVWFLIKPKDNKKYEKFVFDQINKSANKNSKKKSATCANIYKHKCFIVSPEILAANGISVTKVIQNVGEYMVTFADVYHMGYNAGFNINEAINFMLYSDIKLNLDYNKSIQLEVSKFAVI